MFEMRTIAFDDPVRVFGGDSWEHCARWKSQFPHCVDAAFTKLLWLLVVKCCRLSWPAGCRVHYNISHVYLLAYLCSAQITFLWRSVELHVLHFLQFVVWTPNSKIIQTPS